MSFATRVITLVLAGLTSGLTFADGFSKGSQFTAFKIEGFLRVNCSDSRDYSGPTSAFYNCRGYLLDPYEEDYFVTDESIDANKVTLIAENNGRRVEKTEKYLSEQKRSKGTFNLWIASVFQKPLLAPGLNQITYQLKKGSAVVKTGTFEVQVDEAPTKQCEDRTMFSFDIRDCRISSIICARYFREQDYCEQSQ
jgi:hypothetical protein